MAIKKPVHAQTLTTFDPFEELQANKRLKRMAQELQPVELTCAEGIGVTLYPPRIPGATQGPASLWRLEAEDKKGARVEMALPRALAQKIARDSAVLACPATLSELVRRVDELEIPLAAKRLMSLFDKRDYSVFEARAKLELAGYSKAVIDDVIARAEAGKLLDDTRFAEVFVRSKVSAGWGVLRIERELKRKGIVASELTGWPDAYFEDQASEFDRAYELCARKSLPAKNAYPKLVRFLVSRGYSYEVAKACAIKRLEESKED